MSAVSGVAATVTLLVICLAMRTPLCALAANDLYAVARPARDAAPQGVR